jgi:hypothetical protein
VSWPPGSCSGRQHPSAASSEAAAAAAMATCGSTVPGLNLPGWGTVWQPLQWRPVADGIGAGNADETAPDGDTAAAAAAAAGGGWHSEWQMPFKGSAAACNEASNAAGDVASDTAAAAAAAAAGWGSVCQMPARGSCAAGDTESAATSQDAAPCWDSAWRLPTFGDVNMPSAAATGGEAASAAAAWDGAAAGDSLCLPHSLSSP